MLRLGVLGGTFDPIHRGHLAVARAALASGSLDRVLLVPSGVPPHKSGVTTPGEQRLEMVRLATRAESQLLACDLETSREGVSYTVDTLAKIRQQHPGAEISFLIGEDSIAELPGWRDFRRILRLAHILTFPRVGSSHRFVPETFPGVPPEVLRKCQENRIDMDPVPVASRDIRRAIAHGLPFDADVTAPVAEYIRKNQLYGYQEN